MGTGRKKFDKGGKLDVKRLRINKKEAVSRFELLGNFE